MYFEIRRAYTSSGHQLSTAQRTSSRFSEEPLVCGKVLRRNAPPLKLDATQFEFAAPQLRHLVKAGAIVIEEVDEGARCLIALIDGKLTPIKNVPISTGDETTPSTPASEGGEGGERTPQDASSPSSGQENSTEDSDDDVEET